VRRAAALVLLLGLVVLVAALIRGGGHDDETIARVGRQGITEKQLATVVDHFRLEAKREGKPFPDEGSSNFRAVRNRLLGLIVYRTELQQAARRLGVRVTPVQVLRRLHPAGGEAEHEQEDRDSFEYGSVETQLLYEEVFRKVTRGVEAPNQPELSARRNQAMTRYLARLRRETRVRYEPGYGPSS
jgi:SurA-like protein